MVSAKEDQRVKATGIWLDNPLRTENPDVIESISISQKRFESIQKQMGNAFAPSGDSKEFRELLQTAYNLSNILMPDNLNYILRETLTPRQYQKALRANQEGKILKFSKSRKRRRLVDAE